MSGTDELREWHYNEHNGAIFAGPVNGINVPILTMVEPEEAAALLAALAPLLAKLRAVEALAAEMHREGLADSVPGASGRDQVRAGTLLTAADRLRRALNA